MSQFKNEMNTTTQPEAKALTNGTEDHSQHPPHNSKGVEVKIKKSDPNVYVMDSSYGWVICFACFVIYCLAAAFNRALTISFLDFVRIFDVSITTTSLSFTFLLVAISIAALLVMNVMVPLTGERTAVVVGCLGNALCTIGVGLSPNISVFLLCMTFKGLFTGTAFVPCIAMISQYFDKRRSLATSFAYCGLGVGSMAAPPLIEYLKETFGLVGMFLIVGALEMNAVPGRHVA
ncbi:monocarboxylate transporter [Elysia marginata]|uniref:Monocarboxylate transporter n=1 Tax=Elysia marginata TaxID=1093978 RepID=A0AAV4EIK1_9GAST|nr:monocarboxylate transporter [Elysia marginata]